MIDLINNSIVDSNDFIVIPSKSLKTSIIINIYVKVLVTRKMLLNFIYQIYRLTKN